MTGQRGSGKTTLIEALTAQLSLPGVRSYLHRGADGQPRQVVLEARLGPGQCIIGQRESGKMAPIPQALNAAGVAMLQGALRHPSPWVVVDEIGFLEEAGPAYRRALLHLFEEKRVIAALRKADTPLLTALRSRTDCFVLDLDTLEVQT